MSLPRFHAALECSDSNEPKLAVTASCGQASDAIVAVKHESGVAIEG